MANEDISIGEAGTPPGGPNGGVGGTVIVPLRVSAPDTPAPAPKPPVGIRLHGQPETPVETPTAAPAPAPAAAAPVAPVAPAAPPVVPPVAAATPAATPAAATALDVALLNELNAAFAAKGDLSPEDLARVPEAARPFVQAQIDLVKNRVADNTEAAKGAWGANATQFDEFIVSQPDLNVAIKTAPNAAAARAQAKLALQRYSETHSTAPAREIHGSGSGGGPSIPSGVPKNAAEKSAFVQNNMNTLLYGSPQQVNAVMQTIDQGHKLGLY